MWGWAYLNGWFPIVAVQILAMCGMIFSIATLVDCSFVELDARLFFPADMDENLPLEVTQTQYVGFLTWKKLDGSCYWYNSGSNWEDQLTTIHEMQGTDWEKSFLTTAMNAALSIVFFCYLLSFTCSAQVRGVRYFNTVFLCIVLTSLQSISFLAFTSSFCDEYGCTFSRSAYFSAIAMVCFFLSGLCFCCTTNYQGPNWNMKKPSLVPMKKAQVAPDEPERSSVPVSEQMQRAPMEDYNDYEVQLPAAGTISTDVSGNPDIEEVMPDYDEEEIIEEEVTEEHEDDDEIGNEVSMDAVSSMDSYDFETPVVEPIDENDKKADEEVEQIIASDGIGNNENAESGNDDVAAQPNQEGAGENVNDNNNENNKDEGDFNDTNTEYTEVSADEAKR